jgi:hypothetical protein
MDKRVVETLKKERMRRFLQEHMELLCEDRKTLHLKNVCVDFSRNTWNFYVKTGKLYI